MRNLKEFYILGLPIETDLGKAHFIKVRDYPQYFFDLNLIGMSKLEIIYRYSEFDKDGKLAEFIEELKKLDLYHIVSILPEFRNAYYNVFLKVFGNKEVMEHIGEDNFDEYRKLIMEMNCVKEEEVSPNPEIQRAIERSRRVKSMEQDKLTFADICSSIVGYNGLGYEDILDFTIYQLYMTFYRIAQIKQYDTSTLFSTVSADKINIESWSKHIDLYEKEKHYITEDQFKKTTGKMFEKK